MPWHLLELFQVAQKPVQEYFEYIRLEELTRYFWADGTHFTAPAQWQEFVTVAANATGEPAEYLTNYLKLVRKKYLAVGELFLYKPMNKISTYINPKALVAYPQIPSLGLFQSMAAEGEAMLKTSYMRQYFNRFATYNGSDPWQVPALLSVIPHLEHHQGAFFPTQGMYSITESLFKLATDLGVEFHFNSRVQTITTAQSKATGIIDANGSTVPADIIICNADINTAYKHLLTNEKQPKKILAQPKSSSAIIFYWGIKQAFPELGLHNIFFSKDYKKEFDALFKDQNLGDDLTIYLNITSKLKPDDAPEGCENWFTMVNAPNNQGQDWDSLIAKTRKHIIEKLSQQLGADIAPLIVCEQVLDPRTIELNTGSAQGALYGMSSNNRMAAFLRHQNQSPYLKHLYFTGGSVHPGGGVPLALASAKIVADLVQENEGQGN